MMAIWKKVKKIDGKYASTQQPVLQKNNNIITDPKAVANKLAHVMDAVSEVNRYSPNFITYKANIETTNKFLMMKIYQSIIRILPLGNYK